jgi:predicted patatin/cPLA2 family phospholipase
MNGGKNPGKSSTMKEKKTFIVVVFRLPHKGEAGKSEWKWKSSKALEEFYILMKQFCCHQRHVGAVLKRILKCSLEIIEIASYFASSFKHFRLGINEEKLATTSLTTPSVGCSNDTKTDFYG